MALSLALCMATSGMAQAPSAPPDPQGRSTSAQQATTQLDTGESLTYLSRKLWFEMRRRLNLTTEEEERQQREQEARLRLKVGGIRVEAGSGNNPSTVH